MKNIYLIALVFLSGCAQRRDLVYFSDLSKNSANISAKVAENVEPVIRTSDMLSIGVNTQSEESDVLFAARYSSSRSSSNIEDDGYRVDQKGEITFPVLGSVKVEGLTIEQAQKKMTSELKKYVKNPIVNVSFANFRITVIGEVNQPSTFTIRNEKINLLEALGMAGDMTVYGKRQNVLVIREVDGQRSMMRLNLNKQDVMNSPFFYLKQNDIVYVEPDKAKAIENSPNNRLMPLVVATISAIAVVTTAFLR